MNSQDVDVLLNLMLGQANEIDAFNDKVAYVSDTVLPAASRLLLMARGEIIRLRNENERLHKQLADTEGAPG